MIAVDKQTFVAELAETHGGQLRRFLTKRVRNAVDIPDIVQEVFLRLLRVPNHETIRTPEAYIFTIAQHVAQQHALKQANQPESVNLSDVLSDVYAVAETTPELEMNAQQCLSVLDNALKSLPSKAQATFLFHRRDGLSVDEISERLGISRPMTKKYLVKALMHFRKHLKESEEGRSSHNERT